MAIEKVEHCCTDFRASIGDDVRPRLPFIAAQTVCRDARETVRELCRPVRKRASVTCDNQNPRGQTGKRSCVQHRWRDQRQGCDPLRVEGCQAMPIFKRRGAAGGNVSSLDAEVLEEMEA